MREHYNLDGLIDYSIEEIDETTKMVNPEYRTIDGKVRKHVSKLNRKKRKFGEIMMTEAYEQKKSELHEEVINLELFVEELKAERKKTPKHTTMGDLPEEERFRQYIKLK